MIVSKDKKALLAAAYDKYADMLYRLALSHLKRREDAEDAVQDAFIKYISASPRFSDDAQECAWLVRVTVNRCRDMLRRGKFRDHASLDDISGLPAEEKTASAVLDAVFSLPELYRTAITLHYLEGFSVEEIASMLGMSLSAVKMRLSRGRELLKKTVDEEECHV